MQNQFEQKQKNKDSSKTWLNIDRSWKVSQIDTKEAKEKAGLH